MENEPSMAEWVKSVADRDWGVDGETLLNAHYECRQEDEARYEALCARYAARDAKPAESPDHSTDT